MLGDRDQENKFVLANKDQLSKYSIKSIMIKILWYWLRSKQNGRESRNRLMYQYIRRS